MVELPTASTRSVLKTLIIASDILPMGDVVEVLLADLTRLEELRWTPRDNERWMFHDRQWWSPQDMANALLPLHYTLKNLDLLVTIPDHHSKLPHIDFIEFSFLSSLKIDSRILFPWEDYDQGRNNRLDFLERLRKSLQCFHVC